MKDNIGIIGCGYVGTALIEGMKHAFDVETYDKFVPEKSTCDSIRDLLSKTNNIFVCVPTPMNPNGSSDTSTVESVLSEINELVPLMRSSGYVVTIKSTVPPGMTQQFSQRFENIALGFNPEFLTEANFIDDFKNQDRIILGGSAYFTARLGDIYAEAYPDVPIYKCSSTAAEMCKYVTNCFLATKVSFANEIYQVCDKLGVPYDEVIDIATLDKRLGESHWMVPGPDGSPGWGKSCFPKDLNALIYFAKSVGVKPLVMKSVWKKNLEVRENRDWERMPKAFNCSNSE